MLLFLKELFGFGEIFRMLSYIEDIGFVVIMLRVIVGVIQYIVVFLISGLSGVVKLVMNKLIIFEFVYVVREIRKDK